MSELSNVIEARLHAAELAAGNAQSAADTAATAAASANQKLAVSPTAPGTPIFGQIWSDTSVTGVIQVKVYDGTSWIQISPV